MSGSHTNGGAGSREGVLGALVARLGGPSVAMVHACGLGVALLCTAGVGAWLVLPRVSAYVRSGEDAKRLAALHETLGSMQRQLDVAKAKRAKLEQDLTNVVTLRAPEVLNAQLGQLASLASAHQVELRTMQPGQVLSSKEQRSFAVVPIRIGGSGSFAGVTAFLRELSQTMPDVRVMGMKLDAAAGAAGPSGGEEARALGYELTLAWYTLPTGSAGTPGSVKPPPASSSLPATASIDPEQP